MSGKDNSNKKKKLIEVIEANKGVTKKKKRKEKRKESS